jgi:hypothetical protein
LVGGRKIKIKIPCHVDGILLYFILFLTESGKFILNKDETRLATKIHQNSSSCQEFAYQRLYL